MTSFFGYCSTGLFALTIVLLLFYKRSIAPYSKFPNSWVLLKLIPHFVFGKIPKTITRSSFIFRFFMNECKKYEKEGYCIVWIPKPHVILLNEEAVKILSNEQAASHKADKYDIIKEFAPTGLITSNGKVWQNRRKMVNPAFQVPMLKTFLSVFDRNAASLVQRLLEVGEEPVTILTYIKTCTFENQLATFFGIKLEDPDEIAEIEQNAKWLDRLFSIVTFRMVNPLLQPRFMLPFFSTGREFIEGRGILMAWARKFVSKVKQSTLDKMTRNLPAEDEESYAPVLKSVADILVEQHQQNPSFTMEDLFDESVSLLVAGFHTVEYSLMWCLFLLGNHQDVQEKVYEEVKSLTGKVIDYEDLQSLTYTECVLKESIRLYPTVPLYARLLQKDVQCGKHNIPKGTNIVFCPYALQRNPKLYPDPERFDPERFAENSDINPWSYTPFAEGIRNCIGKKYAMIQMKVTLARIFQKFKVTSLQRVEDVDVGWEIVLTPSQPIRLRMTPRDVLSH